MPKLLPESALSELLVGSVGPSVEYHCNSCSADCSSKRYHCQKQVENELPEKIERLVRCESLAYQKLLMKRLEENLGSIGNTKGRSIHNTVIELRLEGLKQIYAFAGGYTITIVLC